MLGEILPYIHYGRVLNVASRDTPVNRRLSLVLISYSDQYCNLTSIGEMRSLDMLPNVICESRLVFYVGMLGGNFRIDWIEIISNQPKVTYSLPSKALVRYTFMQIFSSVSAYSKTSQPHSYSIKGMGRCSPRIRSHVGCGVEISTA